MFTWNYRFVKMPSEAFFPEDADKVYLQEVDYDEDGNLLAHSDPFLIGDSEESLPKLLVMLVEAWVLPVLHEDDF